ncbi:extracellular matrix organizing protein FRAS1 [Procambarus clarkii]|uniref:extracellular matrix organizing protein FRAS1 n=1 Tax=Procambarus clarkii TaxID=6728 RepID=UPI0037446D36
MQGGRRGRSMGWGVAASVSLLCLAVVCLSVVTPASAEGVCYHGGYYFSNGSRWRPEVCLECQCQGWVEVCEREECLDPHCQQDQILYHHPQLCCPRCLPPPQPCLAGDTIYKNGEVWFPAECEQCRCINGTVSCGRKPCGAATCREGQVALQLPNQCCPECVPLGRSCKVGETIHPDGDLWSPVACSQCQCRNGRVQCYVAHCPRLTCPANHTLEIAEGSCCPSCEGSPCVAKGMVYGSSEQWQEGACRKCVCVAGRIHCQEVECPKLECQPHEEPHTVEGACCPKCVKKQGWCLLESGSRMSPGQLWNTTDCELCVCREAQVICNQMECGGDECAPGEQRVTRPGACCPECSIKKGVCFHDGTLRENGEAWSSGDCHICSCVSGTVTCYQPSCLPCSFGLVPVNQNSEHCCPECQPLTCPANCLICYPSMGEIMCKACEDGHYLEDGKCVKMCSEGKFQQGAECGTCHPTCFTCSQATRFHCTKCSAKELLREGECVRDCGRGFYSEGGACLPCHSSCSECSGPATDQCQVCPSKTFLHAGMCVDNCPAGHYARDQLCEPCEESCELCGVGECLQCLEGFWLQEGRCQKDCLPGFYRGPDNACVSCHTSCGTCHDNGIASCTSCPHYLFHSGSTCVTMCPKGTYISEKECLPCHESCIECLGPGPDRCVKCSTNGHAVVLINMTSGRCEDSCPQNYQSLDNVCFPPPPGCEVWHASEPSVCHKCSEGWLQQNFECVLECGMGFYPHTQRNICLSCDPRCHTCSGPGHKNCSSCHKGATLHKRNTGFECLTKCYHHRYLAPDTTCQTCHSSCNVCTLDLANTTTSICLRCKSDHNIRESDHCVHECSRGYYHDVESDSCQKCHPRCDTCVGPHFNNCKTCLKEAKLTNNTVCEKDVCPKGTYLTPENSCKSCEGDCETCPADGSKCLTCPPTKHLLYGKCVNKCPNMFYAETSANGECQECHWTCERCLGPSEADCLTCGSNMFREGNKCLAQCSPGHYPAGKECRACPGGCRKCNSSTVCQSCHAPYLLQDGHCVTSCRSGTFANVFDNICYDCGNKCLDCSLYECHTCKTPYLLQDGQCVDHCGKNYFPDHQAGICYYNIDKPVIHILAPLVVEYGKPLSLNSSFLYIKDTDTSNDHLIVNVEETPSNGGIFRYSKGTNMQLKNGSKFKVEEMQENRIFYMHEIDRPLYGEMRLSVSDGQYQSMTEVISINVISKYPPEIVTNEPFIVFRGHNEPLSTKILNIHDNDNPESVNIRVVDGPNHGQLSVEGEELVLFSLDELLQEQVMYTHDNSTSKTDIIVLQASDEHNVVNFLLQVYIVDEEHSIPVLIKNQGARVESGHMVQISPQLLQARDIDSDDDNLVYTLLPTLQNPGQGKLALIIPLPPAPDGFYNDGWTQMDESHLVRPTTSFTQRDVDEGRVWYVHSGEQGVGDLTSDQLFFSVADDSHPPNILADQSFIIQVEPSQVKTKVLPSPGVQLGITVQEGQAVTITQNHLSFAGAQSAEHLIYTITHPLGPYDGSLFHIDSPGLELRQFMQADINDMKIIYMPPFGDMGQDDKYFTFKFTVSDQRSGEPNKLPEQKFTIHVVPVKGTQLSFTHENPELFINCHASVHLEPKFFELSNLEPEEEVLFILLEAPLHGTITKEVNGETYIFTEEDSLDSKDISDSQILYSHDGSDSTFDAIVFLALGHSSEASTRITVTVRHEDLQHPMKSDNASFSLTLNEYETKVINSWHLHFTDVHSKDEDLVYTLISQAQYGALVSIQPSGTTHRLNETHKFTQADIIYGLVNYTSDKEVGMKAVVDNLAFNVTDPQNNVLSNQVLKVTIQGVDNKEPEVVMGEAVTVAEGSSVILSPASITASDIDTPLSNLTVIIDAPPLFGYITNTNSEPKSSSGGASPMLEFTMKDLQEGKVTYIQSQHRHQEPIQDSFLFHVTDGTNGSPVMRFNITIQLINDESPVILGEQVVIEKGQTAVIRNQSLFISDADTQPKDLIVKIEQSPNHGSLHRKLSRESSIKNSELLTRGQSFTFQDLLDELILYSHDGSRDPEDIMEIMVSDSNHETGGIVEFIILQKTDEAPRLRLNHGLTLKAGEISVISPSLLIAEDVDSETEMIKYVVTSLPISGKLEIYQSQPDKWMPLNVGSVFMQKDIINGNIRFVHKKDTPSGTDTLRFNLQDTEGNVMMDQALSIIVLEDRIPPRITLNTVLTLMEDASAAITAEFLSATDAEMDPMELKYILVSGPDHGRLELTTAPGKAVSSWTQRALELGILHYHHHTMDESTKDQFSFVVSDGYNNVSQSFSINITPVDDEIPLLVTNTIKVQEGTRKIISQFEIEALDADTRDEFITFSIVRPPRHGQMQVTVGEDYLNSKTFTMLDVYNGEVSYLHEGSDTSHDSFDIVVSDSTNTMYRHGRGKEASSEPSTINIEISSVDDGTPILTANRGLQYLQQEEGKAQNLITAHELHVEDEDTLPDNLQFSVTRPPAHGVLRLTTHERPVSAFTQADIIAGRLYYELVSYAHDTTSDEFTFEVTDSKPNIVSGNVFHIQWAWLIMAQREYNVTETDGAVKVFVRRTGNLKQHSSVTCVTHGGSAKGKSKEPQDVDFSVISEPVQFSEGETEKYCTVPIHDDEEFEGLETFSVKLVDPNYALLGKPKKSHITIIDKEDKPSVGFENNHFIINEAEGLIYARLKRRGDVNIPVSVVCISEDGSAKGSDPKQIASGADFIHRPHDESSRVVFPPGIQVSSCNVKIIDDPVFEVNEDFRLILIDPSEGVMLGEIREAFVTIKGPNDQSKVGFTQSEYNISESEDVVSVYLERSGVDLSYPSTVWCATKSYTPEEAQPSLDYVPHSEQVNFREDQESAICTINLIDDKVNPKLEGPERFIVFISTAQNASINRAAAEAVVTINDDEDAPSIQFTMPEIKVRENQTVVKIPIQRSGDLSRVSTVYCFTRQRSAKAGIDFIERPNTKDSAITFPKGVSKVECEVGLLDDLVYEKEERFIVKLSHPGSPSDFRPHIGENKIVRVTILDWEDRPRVSLQHGAYTIAEPQSRDLTSSLSVPIIRLGDTSQVSRVMVSTRDGSAASGSDYHPLHTQVEFAPGDTMFEVEITIVHNSERQRHETFSVVLGPDDPVNAELGAITSASVTILDHETSGSSVLPAPPIVVSLLHYDNIAEHLGEPASPGYPLVCVTPCDMRYPESAVTTDMCAEAGINSTSIQYSWEVAVPADGAGSLTPFHSLTDNTLFASPYTKVLDSMFFARHFWVRCIAQPVKNDGVFGIPLRSKATSVGIQNGICQTPLVPGQPGGFQSQSFMATLSYINSTDENHPNTVKIHVEIPHQDGMVPILSTLPFHNLRYLLTEQLYRVHHMCSNLDPLVGFLAETPLPYSPHPRPHQWDENLRENKSLLLYHHLNLRTCMWTFSAWFSMSQLVDRCGGQVVSDFQVGSGGQSFLTVRVPLYISYVYATSPPGWASVDHRTELSVSLYYNTLLWHHGLLTQPTLTAKIQVTRISIDESGRLVIDIKTMAKFRGQFVLHHPHLDEFNSQLKAPMELDILFSLELLWTASTWDGPEQVWRATSDYNLKDYTGEYIFELIPCTVAPTQAYTVADPPPCTPHPPTNFTLPIAIQQTHRPVPLVYTLNTDFQLLNSPTLFLMDPRKVDNLEEVDYKGSYGPGQTIYGRVLWHPSQDLYSAYQLYIQRVFLCTGDEGYVPTYDPTGELYDEGPQYGCIQPSTRLRHRFLILDREQPYVSESNLSSPQIVAHFAEDLPEFDALRQFSGVDGFLLNTDGLYQVNSGQQWYLQVLYTIGPNSGRSRRDATLLTTLSHVVSQKSPGHSNFKRENLNTDLVSNQSPQDIIQGMKVIKGISDVSEDLPVPAFLTSLHVRNGTNMRGFQLHFTTVSSPENSVFLNVLYVIVSLVVLLAIIITGLLVVKRFFRNSGKDKVIVVRSLKNEREEFRRKGEGKVLERPKTLPPNMTLNSESNLQTVKVKTLAITVRNNLEDEGTEV